MREPLIRAIADCLIAGYHLRAELAPGHPPATAAIDEGLRAYTGCSADVFNIWWAWREIERLRLAIGTRDLATAIDACLMVGDRLGDRLGPDAPPATNAIGWGLSHYGGMPCGAFNVWMGWRGIMRMRQACSLENDRRAFDETAGDPAADGGVAG